MLLNSSPKKMRKKKVKEKKSSGGETKTKKKSIPVSSSLEKLSITSNAKENVNNSTSKKTQNVDPITIPITPPKKRIVSSTGTFNSIDKSSLISPRNSGRSSSTGKRVPTTAVIKREEQPQPPIARAIRPSTSQSLSKSPFAKQASMSGLKFPRQSEESFATSSSRKSSSDESSSEVESEMEKQPEKPIEKPVEKPIEKPPTPIVQENYVSLFQNTEALNRVFAKSKEVSQIPDFWFYTPTFIPMTQWEQPNTSKFNCPNYGTLDTLSFNTLTSSYNSIRQNCPLVVLEKKKFCNPVPFIDSFNKYYGEK